MAIAPGLQQIIVGLASFVETKAKACVRQETKLDPHNGALWP